MQSQYIQIKPHSFVNPSLIRGIFKGFLYRAKKLFFEKYFEEELNFLIGMLAENAHDQNYLNSIVKLKNIKHLKLKKQTTPSPNYHRWQL